jgi:hypothetical protein
MKEEIIINKRNTNIKKINYANYKIQAIQDVTNT